ncbi:MAG TPA: GTP cyclohydrolase MptA [Candidatus Thermoplasmatota archaeon]|nr:GTP cyclohydrolase MptA [Candidatus Thermoplasmatota archaeon]
MRVPPSSALPDVQSLRSLHPYRLTRVGVTGIKKPVHVKRPDRPAATLVATFDVYVDLPRDQRGIHMSRNVEAVNATIDELARETTGGLEDLAARIVETLLRKHDYATVAEVEIEVDYFRERLTPANHAATLEHHELVATAVAKRGRPVRRGIGVVVTGMTACPCAMEGTRKILRDRGAAVEDIPTITHNQRNHLFILLETDVPAAVEADDLLDVAEESLSAPTFELLKRGDETALVLQAHEHPRFVEDVVREALARVAKRYAHLPDDATVLVRSEAEESIHKHNAVAEECVSLGELRG